MPRVEATIIRLPIRPRGAGTPEPRSAAPDPSHARGTGAVQAWPHLGSHDSGAIRLPFRQPAGSRETKLMLVAAVLTVLMTACGTALVADDFTMLVTVLAGALTGAAAFGLGLAVTLFGSSFSARSDCRSGSRPERAEGAKQ